MTLLDQMKADAAECNKKMRRATGAGQKAGAGTPIGRTPAVASRHMAVRPLMDSGLTYRQIADRLGIKASTVKSDISIIRAEGG